VRTEALLNRIIKKSFGAACVRRKGSIYTLDFEFFFVWAAGWWRCTVPHFAPKNAFLSCRYQVPTV